VATIIVRNWRDVSPTVAHKSGIDWRLLSMAKKTSGDIDAVVEPKFQCLENITYVSLAKLKQGLSYEPHKHDDHEEVYYIINGKGSIRIGEESAKFRDGDAIYIPEKKVHSIVNDGDEVIEFLAFGGLAAGKEKQT
jgi:mannose-6-phosphate isomerase-like protein (cupin superfamily)